jgi:hypothetical protein
MFRGTNRSRCSLFCRLPVLNELVSAQLIPVKEVLRSLRQEPEKWCYWSGLIFISFLARHGVLTQENEPNLDKIISRIHGDLSFVSQDYRIMAHRAAAQKGNGVPKDVVNGA